MVLSLLASLCLQTSTIDLLPGYYIADDFARLLSSKEHRIHVSEALGNRLYAARLHECSRDDFTKMLEDGLNLRLVERNGETVLEEKPEEIRKFERFRRELGKRLDKYVGKLCAEADKVLPSASRTFANLTYGKEDTSTPTEGRRWVLGSSSFFPYSSLIWLRKNGASSLLEHDQVDERPFGSVVNESAYPSKVRDYYRVVWPQLKEKETLGYLKAEQLYHSIVETTKLKQSISFDPSDISVSIVEKLDGGDYGSLIENSKIGIPKSMLEGFGAEGKSVDLALFEKQFGTDWQSYSSETGYGSQLLLSWATAKNINLIAEVSLFHDYGHTTLGYLFKPGSIGNIYLFAAGFADREQNRVTHHLIPKIVGKAVVVRNSSLVWESTRKHPITLIKSRLSRSSLVDGHMSINSLLDLVSLYSGSEIGDIGRYQLNRPIPQFSFSLQLLKVLSLLSTSERKMVAERLLRGDLILIGINGLRVHSGDRFGQVIEAALEQMNQTGPNMISLKVDIPCKTYFILHADQTAENGVYRILAIFNNNAQNESAVDKDKEFRDFWDRYMHGGFDFLQFQARL